MSMLYVVFKTKIHDGWKSILSYFRGLCDTNPKSFFIDLGQ